MNVNILMGTLVYGSVLALLSLGITLIYMTTKVFNFAHPRLSLFGAYLAITAMAAYITGKGIQPDLTVHEGIIPYRLAYPASVYIIGAVVAIVGGIIAAMVEYYLILKPLLDRGSDYLQLMIATLAYDFILMAVLFLYNTHVKIVSLLNKINVQSTSVDFSSYDLYIMKGYLTIPGDALYSTLIVLIITAAIYILLFKTTLGVKMRASIENPPLAEVLGINVRRIYALSWIISGATAGLAGFFIMMRPSVAGLKPISATSPADEIVVSAFAGSIVGGVNSIFGSLAGGMLIGFIEVYVTFFIGIATGLGAITKYSRVISMFAVGLFLLFAPQGLAGLYKKYLAPPPAAPELGEEEHEEGEG
ncbi:MAG: branched-chain amino acid ABC transporter permease [Desulfurococcales archaeon]|nr:branched-chain amino acid ABC transporter permease [Desulfurococcales archaeon]